MRKAKITIITLFAGTLAAFFLISVFQPQKDFSATENRSLEQRPQVCAEDILSGDFQETYESYLNDQFVARDRWVDLAVGRAKLSGQRDVNGIYLGRDGYLLEKYTDGDFDPEITEDYIGILGDYLNRMTDQYGQEHVNCLLVPGKASALPQKLPAYAVPFEEQEVVEALEDELEQPQILLNLTDTMREHREEYIYYRTDHHWTTLGAYYAYEEWCGRTGRPLHALEEYDRETVSDSFYGSSFNKCHQKVRADTIELFHGPGEQKLHVDINDGEQETDSCYQMDALKESDQYQVFFDGHTAKITVDTGIEGKGTLLLVKDSYANCFVPFLAENFSRIVMVDLRYNSDCIDDVMDEYPDITDVMVLYNIEKFLQSSSNIDLLEEYE